MDPVVAPNDSLSNMLLLILILLFVLYVMKQIDGRIVAAGLVAYLFFKNEEIANNNGLDKKTNPNEKNNEKSSMIQGYMRQQL